jgi:hypothetical protein
MYLCDFCGKELDGSLEDHWSYQTKPFAIQMSRSTDGETMVELYDEKWSACDDCAGLIEAGNKDALVERSVDNFMETKQAPASERHAVAFMIDLIHATFWDLRTDETAHPMVRMRVSAT